MSSESDDTPSSLAGSSGPSTPSRSSLQIKYDRYGFVDRGETEEVPDAERRRKQKKEWEIESRRESKWIRMFDDWDRFVEKKPKKLLERLRKGVPDRVRAKSWQKILRLNDLLVQNPGRFLELAQEKSVCDEEIERDIQRTFPSNLIIKQGEASLYNVLRAYSNYDREVGYCQGMGFISGLFLIYMTEEEAFWLLTRLLDPRSMYNFRGLCLPGLPSVHKYMSIYNTLLEKHLPKVHKHMMNIQMDATMYCPQWFITAYTHDFPFDLVVRIWDIFLFEGNAILFQVAIALMKSMQDDILPLGFEKCMSFIKNIPKKYLDPNWLLPLALELPITPDNIASLDASLS
eukprot:TRINITY_DN12698_c0_g1_i1.p1 TRINITY_DN12698_c0_g1~~TRINITY_DN12698_c0_g1_i1.p1  ORF type:complete len:345 (-),score=81.62 TRINITY_DN12698_c0_g1_i1:262-1296(-)